MKEFWEEQLQTQHQERKELIGNLKKIETPERANHTDRLEKLGLKTAAKKMGQAQKLAMAYEQYMFIDQETVQKFNDKLKQETLKEDKRAYYFKQLVFIPLEKYSEVPPDVVLDKLETAKNTGIFDRFDIAKIEWKEEIKDPLLFGIVDGCTDLFFICQWDDDIALEDLIFTNTERAVKANVRKEEG